ncbi:MAG: precorrin-8X methylmutase [Rhodospirillales bacterium]|nr:precorrin-8X methylmutase [Rhodospirillales bacterium]
MTLDYLRDPQAIYDQSFAMIRAETDLSVLPGAMVGVAVRVIHACGMTDIVEDLVFSDDAVASGWAALAAGAPILTDVKMVAAGIIRSRLPAGNDVICMLDDDRVCELARVNHTTRSAAAVDLWRPHLQGAVVTIGNAPTALFRLLEILDEGGPRPAIVLGFPVGFVGAAESKDALIAHPTGVPYIALRGRRGGSAMASAAVNALMGNAP